MKIPAVSTVVKPLLNLAMHKRPFVVKNAMIEKMLQEAFCEALDHGHLDFLEQHHLALDIHDVSYRITIGLQQNQLKVMAKDQAAEVVLRGELKEFMALAARREEPGTLLLQRRLGLEGDTELVMGVKNLMDRADLGALPLWVQQGIKIAEHFQRS